MRKWEDIVKDKLEEPEGTLPESVFAEFRSRREAAAPAPKRALWVWVAVPAVAAGLAAVLLLREPAVPTDGVQLIDQPQAPVALVPEEDIPEVPEAPSVLEAVDATPVPQQPVKRPVNQPVKPVEQPAEQPSGQHVEQQPEQQPGQQTETQTGPQDEQKTEPKVDEQSGQPVWTSPFVPEPPLRRAPRMKVSTASGIVGGGGLLAAAGGLLVKGNAAGGGHPGFMGPNDDRLVGDPVHYFPIRTGLSVGIPITRRWFLSTGLNYSLYLSKYTYKIAGEKMQAAHYLGIPVRMNWAFASNRYLDVYVGAGLEGDVCLNAGGFSLSLQGVGGFQFKPIPQLGIYIEPELGWRIPTGTPKLETYRSQHPLMFSVAAGLRYNIENKKK